MNRSASTSRTASILACCHGFTVRAVDRPIGTVETPVFSGTGLEPDSLLVRAAGSPPGSSETIAVALVAGVDLELEEVVLSVGADEAISSPGC